MCQAAFWGGQFMVGGFKKKSYTALRITTMLFIHLLGMLVVVEVWVETESESMRRQNKTIFNFSKKSDAFESVHHES